MALHAMTVSRGVQLCEFLMDGPATIDQIMEHMGLSFHATRDLLKATRDHVCPQYGMAIPRPVADDGYLYRLTGTWIDQDEYAIVDGVGIATKDGRTRLDSIIRDYEIARDTTDGRTREGKQVREHLDILRGALASIRAVDHQLGLALVPATNGN